MTSKSVLIRPHTEESGEDIGCGDDPQGQAMAAGDDDDDDMAWLEETQNPHSDEEDAAAYEFPELEMGFVLISTINHRVRVVHTNIVARREVSTSERIVWNRSEHRDIK